MDPSTTTGNSLDAAAAQAATLTASKVDSSHQPPRSTREPQAENAPLPDASTELTTDKGPQSQAASKTKRPRSSIFDPSSTTVSHWSKRPRKSVASKATSVAAPCLKTHLPEIRKVAVLDSSISQSGGAQSQKSKDDNRQDTDSSISDLKIAKVSDSTETNAVSSREASGQQVVSSAKAAPTVTIPPTLMQTPPPSSSLSRSSSVASFTTTATYSPSSLAPSPFITPSLASFLSASKPATQTRDSSTLSRSSSLLSSTISSASGRSRTSSASSLSSICSSVSSRSSSSSSLRRGKSGTTRHTLTRSSSYLRQTALSGSTTGILPPLSGDSEWTKQNPSPKGVSADAEAEEDYSFLVTPNVMAVSDEILSMSSPYPIDDLETLVSQESTCDECSSCSSSIPLPCPDYVLQPLDERPLEWQHNRPTQDVPLTETVADTITTTKSASAPEPDENAELIRPVLMSRSKTLQATSVAHIEGASYTSPLRRPNGDFRRHKTMQGIKNEFKVASAAAHGGNKAASVIDSQQPVPTTLPPREAEENQILPFTDPPSGSNDFAKRISPTTMVDVLEGKYKSQYDVLMLIDCRFAYEYKGGHIKSAVNIHDKRELDRVLFEKSPLIHKRVLVILHCEFSCERGPGMAKHLRSMDRTANSINYPALYYPELYVLDGGYSRFFKEYPDYCTPQNYVSMLDPAYRQEYERARVAHRSAFGRTVSKGFLGMESNAQSTMSQPSAKNSEHSSNISQTTGNSDSTITITNSSSSSGKSSKATTVGLGLRGRSRTIPDLRSIAKLNVEQFRQYARAAKEAH
ncbi:cell division cycle- protein [Actinomortierella wolfii]|nr:cell division cycle- protein [Actinomortierella wolfii]